MGWVHTLNERVADSPVGRYFDLKGRRSTFSTEVRAGVVCFLTVSEAMPARLSLPQQQQSSVAIMATHCRTSVSA